jgi:O-antigen/teichoic acid export membrane protein
MTAVLHEIRTVESAVKTAGSKRLSLLHSMAWSLWGNLGHSACQWGVVIALARNGDASMVGHFALAMAVTTPIMLLANCALRTVQATDMRDECEFADYLSFRLASSALAATLFALIALGCQRTTGLVLLGVGAAKVFESLSDVIHGLMQRLGRMDLIGKSQTLRGPLALAAVIAATIATPNVVLAAWLMAGAYAAAFLVYDLPAGLLLVRHERVQTAFVPRWNSDRLRALLQLALPMGITVMAGAVIANVPRYFLEYFCGAKELGLFAALAWIALSGNLVATAVVNASLPRLAEHYARAESIKFRATLGSLMVAGAFAGIVSIAIAATLGPTLLRVIYGAEYAAQAQVFTVLVVAMALSFEICCLDHALYAARAFRVQVPINLIVTPIIVIASWWAVPRYGLVGAAWVTTAIAALQVAVRMVVIRSLVRDLARS